MVINISLHSTVLLYLILQAYIQVQNFIHFQYLLKYSSFIVLMDHSALKRIYCSKIAAKTDFSFDIEHISGKYMFIYDFLSRFSSDNHDEEPIPYLTDTNCLRNESYMSYLETMCKNNYSTKKGICTAIKHIGSLNLQNNEFLSERTHSARNNKTKTLPTIIEESEDVDQVKHFPCIMPLTSQYSQKIQLKTRKDFPNQETIDRIVN